MSFILPPVCRIRDFKESIDFKFYTAERFVWRTYNSIFLYGFLPRLFAFFDEVQSMG